MNQSKGTIGRLGIILIGALAAAAAAADSTVRMDNGTVMQVRDGSVRLSTDGESAYTQFDGSRNVLIHVEPDSGTYTEIDEATLTEQSKALEAAQVELAAQMSAMRAELDRMPEAQRRMIEQRMGGMLGSMMSGEAPEPVRVVPEGNRSVAGFACTDYRLEQGSSTVAEVCLAAGPGAGMSQADFASLGTMMAFMRSMAGRMREALSGFGGGFDPVFATELEGIPVTFHDRRSGDRSGVESVSNAPLDEALFNGHRGLRKQTLATHQR